MRIYSLFVLLVLPFVSGCLVVETDYGIGGTILGRAWAVQTDNMPFLYGRYVKLVNATPFPCQVTVAATNIQFFAHADGTKDEFLRSGESTVVRLPGNYTRRHSIEGVIDMEFWDLSGGDPVRIGIVILHGSIPKDRPIRATLQITADMICPATHSHQSWRCWNGWRGW